MKTSSFFLFTVVLAGCARSSSDEKPAVTLERAVVSASAPAATWTPLATWNADANIMLLTDGTVLGFNQNGTVNKLAPSATGTYDASTWTAVAAMHDPRLYFGSHVLPDGRVFVVGGEYGTGHGKGEVYDPIADTWTTPFDAHGASDTETALLPDGTVYIAWTSEVYDPATNTTHAGTAYPAGGFDEAGFVLLSDKSYLTIPINSTQGYRYVTSTNAFVLAGTVPFSLYDSGSEIGPGIQLYNGKVLWIGANGKSVLYTPGAAAGDQGTWVAGPTIPSSLMADDAPAAVMPSGNVLFIADKGGYVGPAAVFEYDVAANTMTASAGAPAPGVAYTTRMLVLPTGQILVSTGSAGYLYTAAGTPDPAWKPTITTLASKGSGVYELTGTQLHGYNEGAAYGDDAEMATNFPLIRFEGPGTTVTYARTFNWLPTLLGLGTTAQKTQFKLPASLADGTYNLVVVTNGIPSTAMPVTINGGNLVINDFSLSQPATVNVPQAGMATTMITTTKVAGVGESVALTATALPTGITVAFAPASVTSDNGTSTLTISATPTAALGPATFTVKATGSSISRTKDVSINVQMPPDMAIPPDMTVPRDLADPNDLSQSGGGTGTGGGGTGGGGGGDGGGKGCSCTIGGNGAGSGGGVAAALLLAFALGFRARRRRQLSHR
jgi:MYXO-CTERM domain-containing protein